MIINNVSLIQEKKERIEKNRILIYRLLKTNLPINALNGAIKRLSNNNKELFEEIETMKS